MLKAERTARRWAGRLTVVALAVIGLHVATLVSVGDAEANEIRACVQRASGQVRILGAGESCHKAESALQWTVGAGGFRGVAEFTTAGSHVFIAPDGVTSVLVELWGAGGGGSSGRRGSVPGCGDGGGAGGYSRAVVPVVPGGRYTITVGAGGAGGVPTRSVICIGSVCFPGGPEEMAPGGAGEASSFDGLVTASGGEGSTLILGAPVPGAGGEGDPSAPVSRRGRDGHHRRVPTLSGSTCEPGGGGVAIQGSIEPVGSDGGAGGNGSFTSANSNGEAGRPGYVLIHY